VTNPIEIKNLYKTFRGKKGVRINALKDLSLTVEPGEVFGFLGPNGAGKSTTIKTLIGLIRPSAGTARIMNNPVDSHICHKKVGYLSENPSFYDYLNADEFLMFVGRSFGMDRVCINEQGGRILKRLDLDGSRKRLIRSYSKGMVQRLGIAQCLLHDPDLYILDEPMSGLDPIGRALVKEIIKELKKSGKTVFFSTHITTDVEEICDRVGILVKGELKYVGRIESILASGVNEYKVSFKNDDSLEEKRVIVSVGELAATLMSLQKESAEILLVEPCRNTLENFFLNIVRNN
jgi:ABC-2 type transport system ATP-binding protein